MKKFVSLKKFITFVSKISKNMKQIKLLLIFSICFGLTMTSCEKTLVSEDESTPSSKSEQGERNSLLTVATRSGDVNDNTVADGCVYIFDSGGECVEMLTTNSTNTSASVELPAGSYSVYAIGGNDLTKFTLPSQATATATSVLTLQSGKTMGELLQKQADVTLEDGDDKTLPLTLDRKVICINDVEITNVPEDVTQVEVTLASFYRSMRLDGSYLNSPTESFKIALTKQSDGTTWKAEPQQMLFPSKGAPMVTVTITNTTGTQGFSYTAANAMQANHHYSINANYNVPLGGNLTCTLVATDWDEDQTITFDLDEDSQIVYNPVAGQYCYGYYCVSVDEGNRTAVLLALSKLVYDAPDSGASATEWRAALTGPMTALEKPVNVTNAWRLPTPEEVEIITQDLSVVTYGSDGYSPVYFCEEGGVLKWGCTHQVGETFNFSTGTQFADYFLLRPVIDINY